MTTPPVAFPQAPFYPEDEWIKTISGRIYAELEGIAKKANQSIRVEGKGELHEYFHVNEMTAKLSKHLEGATVGETGGTIKSYVEAWDFQHFPWWKEAIDHAHVKVGFLEYPIHKIAQEANIPNADRLFIPSEVLKSTGYASEDNPEKIIATTEWVKDQIQKVISPLLAPEFEVKYYEGCLRLHPKNEQAKESLLSGGSSYQRAVEAARKAAVSLQGLFTLRDL